MLLLVGCGRPKTFDSVTVRRPAPIIAAAEPLARRTRPAPTVARAANLRHWNETIVWNTLATAATERDSIGTSSTDIRTVAAVGTVPCDGDLPPCRRVTIESHGDWNAYNAGGCDGHNCYGLYQFSGAWAGKLGLPLDLATTTHEQWVNAARLLWNDGKGCGNWDACG